MKTSFWDYLATLPGSFEAQLLYALIMAGTFGMTGNWLSKWAKNEIEGSLWCYLFHASVRRTLLSFLSFIGASAAAIGAGIFVTGEGHFVGWSNVLWFGFTNGFAVDAIVNKGNRFPWSPEAREKATVTKDKPS